MADGSFTPDKRLAALQAALAIAKINDDDVEAVDIVDEAETILKFLCGGDKA